MPGRRERGLPVSIFPAFTRRRGPAVLDEPGGELPPEVRRVLPARFEAVGEALASSADTRASCGVVGRDVARDGAALGEALDGLRMTYHLVVGREPNFAATEALSVAWSEATLEFLHDLSCEDPLTGLASLAHVRTRLDEVYREAELTGVPVLRSHALVVVEMSATRAEPQPGHRFARALHLVQVTETVRMVFAGEETLGRLGADRAVVVVRRAPDLGSSVATLRELVGDLDLGGLHVRLWIEGLPASAGSATRLLDDLARG